MNLKFRLKFNQGFTNHDCLHCAVLKVLYDFKEKGAHKEKYSQIFFKLEFWYFESAEKHHEIHQTACWFNSKISNRESKTTLMILYSYVTAIVVHYFRRRSLMLWNSTSSNHLKLTVQIQLALHPCDLFLINDRKMTGNKVENYCFVALNVKLQVKLRFKTFYWLLKLLYTAFVLSTTTNMACCTRNFSICS